MSRWMLLWSLVVLLLCAACGEAAPDEGLDEVSVAAADTLLNDPDVLYVFDKGAPDGNLVIGPHARVHFPRCVNFSSHRVTVLEGSVLTFDEGGCLNFSWGASLQVQGSATDSVFFKPAAGGKHWGYLEREYVAGLNFYGDNAGHSSISYAVIDSATTAIMAKSSNGMTIAHSRISHSSIHGIELGDRAAIDASGIRHCQFVDNAQYDIYIKRPNLLLRLGDSLSAQKDLKIGVTGGTIDTIGIIANVGSPITVLGQIEISDVYGEAAVTVEGGNIFKMDTGSGWWASWGSLTFAGKPEAPIRLSPARPGAYWEGISTTNALVLNHVELDSALIGVEALTGSAVEIQHTVLRGNQLGLSHQYGKVMLGNGGMANTRFVGNTTHASIAVEDLALIGEGNAFDSAGAIEIQEYSDPLTRSARIRAYDAPYHVQGLLYADADTAITLAIDPGVRMLFAEGARFKIGRNASLAAQGTVGDSIIMDELEEGKGWGGKTYEAGGVTFRDNAGPSQQMSYVSLRHAGQGVYMDGEVQVQIDHTTLAHNTRYGIYVASSATLVEGEGMNYVENGSGNVRLPD